MFSRKYNEHSSLWSDRLIKFSIETRFLCVNWRLNSFVLTMTNYFELSSFRRRFKALQTTQKCPEMFVVKAPTCVYTKNCIYLKGTLIPTGNIVLSQIACHVNITPQLCHVFDVTLLFWACPVKTCKQNVFKQQKLLAGQSQSTAVMWAGSIGTDESNNSILLAVKV